MLTLKTKCMIAYCHRLLHDSEELLQEGKGVAVIDDEETREFTRDCGMKIMKYCESKGATHDMLGDLSKKSLSLWNLARAYYGLQIDLYQKYISAVKGRHVPILYAAIMFQLLHKNGTICLDIDYDKLLSVLEVSDKLEVSRTESRFGRWRMITSRVEVNKYHTGVREILEQTMSFKTKRKSKKKRKR